MGKKILDELKTLISSPESFSVKDNKDHREGVKNNLISPKFSVILINEFVSEKALENPLFYKKEEYKTSSKLTEKAIKHFESKKITDKIEKKIEKKLQSTTRNPKYWAAFDQEIEKEIAKCQKEIHKKLHRDEVYFHILDNYPNYLQDPDDPLDSEISSWIKENPQESNDLLKKLAEPRVRYDYTRRYEAHFPENIASILLDDPHIRQYYFFDHENKLHYANSNRGSYGRLAHGYLGHYFAEVNKTRKIPTYILYFDSDRNLNTLKLDSLVLFNRSLTGNYSLDYDVSKEILSSCKLLSDLKEFKFLFFLKGIIF